MELTRQVSSSGPPSVVDREHRLTTAGLLMLVTFVAFEFMAVATAMPTAVRSPCSRRSPCSAPRRPGGPAR